MKMTVYILTMIILSTVLPMMFRLDLTKKIEYKRKIMEISSKVSISVTSLIIIIRIMCYISVLLLAVLVLKMGIPEIRLMDISFQGSVIENIGVVTLSVIACGSVIFMLWGGIAAGVFKVDIYKTMNGMNVLKINPRLMIYTKIIRPIVLPIIESYIFYCLMFQGSNIMNQVNQVWFILLGTVLFTFYKSMIYKKKDARIVSGAWYMWIYIFGATSFIISGNYITVIIFMMISNLLWIYKQ